MNQLKKLNAMHKILMCFLAGEKVLKEGELKELWSKDDHTQHTSGSFRGQFEIFKRQIPNAMKNLENEDEDLIESSLEMYKKDREKLKFNIQNDKVGKELFPVLQKYIEELNDLIILLEAALRS